MLLLEIVGLVGGLIGLLLKLLMLALDNFQGE